MFLKNVHYLGYAVYIIGNWWKTVNEIDNNRTLGKYLINNLINYSSRFDYKTTEKLIFTKCFLYGK